MNILNYLEFLFNHLKLIDDDTLKEKAIFESLCNISYDKKITPDNYLDVANLNFTFDMSKNWLYDRKNYENSHAYAKIYVPIKSDYFYQALREFTNIIEEIRNLNIGLGQSKFRVTPANDAVILRLQSERALLKALELIENNPLIKRSIDKPNLFIPNINGLGITSDFGGSYLLIVEILLTNYLKECLKNEERPTLKSFINFIENTDFTKNLLIFKMCDYDIDLMYDYKETLIGKTLMEDDKKLIKSFFK